MEEGSTRGIAGEASDDAVNGRAASPRKKFIAKGMVDVKVRIPVELLDYLENGVRDRRIDSVASWIRLAMRERKDREEAARQGTSTRPEARNERR